MTLIQDMASLKGIEGINRGDGCYAKTEGHYFVGGFPVLAIVRVFNDSLDGRLQVVSEIPSEPLNGILK